MKNRKSLKIAGLLAAALLVTPMMWGCSMRAEENRNEENLSPDNIIITETGEVLEKEEEPVSEQAPMETEAPKATTAPEATIAPEENSDQEIITPDMSRVKEPEQEQIITDADQVEPKENGLQLVFLGDSIFDTYRDGTGIPFRTAALCDAQMYNLAIGGTCAAVDLYEPLGSEEWTSRSMVGVVKAIIGDIPSDIFANDACKKILDDPNVDFSKTDYFIVEYGTNDFFSSVPLDSEGELYNLNTYAGALRYAVSNLSGVAPDATIILCSPAYARFFDGTWMIGDGNSVNNGQGTLFDYKGICQYVANSTQSLFFNAYQDLGIDGYTAEEYLEDGVHLTDAGRQLYAEALAKMILQHEETKNN